MYIHMYVDTSSTFSLVEVWYVWYHKSSLYYDVGYRTYDLDWATATAASSWRAMYFQRKMVYQRSCIAPEPEHNRQ